MTHDKAHRAATVVKLAARTERLMRRPCPVLRFQRATNQAYIAFKLNGVRRTLYFGVWLSPAAEVAYAKFERSWPRPLFDTPPPKPRPAPRLLEHDGRVQTLTAWAREVGLKRSVLAYRVDFLGWPIGRAITTPSRTKAVCPRLCHDPRSGRALVRWTGRRKRLTQYLGAWGSAEAEAAYAAFCERWAAGRV